MWIHGLPWTSKSGWGAAGLPVVPIVPRLGLARPGVIAGVMEPVDLLAPGISSRPANTEPAQNIVTGGVTFLVIVTYFLKLFVYF